MEIYGQLIIIAIAIPMWKLFGGTFKDWVTFSISYLIVSYGTNYLLDR